MSFGNRLKARREALGITQPQLAEMLGVSKGAIGNYETDANSPKATILYKVFDVLKCDANYLFQDEMNDLYKDTATPEEFENIIKKYRSLDLYGQETVNIVLDREVARTQQLQAAKVPAAARIYTYMHKIACAGSGFYFDDIPTDTIEAPYREGADFIFGVSGDSMEPTYRDGDLVYVQKSQVLNIGDIGIFIVHGECFIKEAAEDGLKSHNAKYPTIPGSEHIICVGKVLDKARMG